MELGAALEIILPYHCIDAGIVRVPQGSMQDVEGTTQVCNLLHWPLCGDVKDVSAVATGEIEGYETFVLVRKEKDGALHRVATAMALVKGKVSEHWGPPKLVVEGA
jgi:hypothetical protein